MSDRILVTGARAVNSGTLRGQQRNLLMYRLQIFCHQVRVSPRHLKTRMPEHFLEVEHRAAFAEVVDCESVPECVQSSLWWIKPKAIAEQLHVTKDHTPAELAPASRAEHKHVSVWAELGRVTHESFPKLE